MLIDWIRHLFAPSCVLPVADAATINSLQLTVYDT